MATPIAHSLAGYAVSRFFRKTDQGEWFNLSVLCIVMANAPDLDFLPGIILAKPALYHHGITHSFGFALMVSLSVAAICRLSIFRMQPYSLIFILCFTSYLSHLLIDFLGPDRRPPIGMPLFWPVIGEYFISPVCLFLGVHHAAHTSASTSEWVEGLLSLYNVAAIALEIVLIGPFILLVRRYRGGRTP